MPSGGSAREQVTMTPSVRRCLFDCIVGCGREHFGYQNIDSKAVLKFFSLFVVNWY